METARPHALTLTHAAAAALVGAAGHAPYRAKQILEWIFRHQVRDPDRMSNLPRELREALREGLDWTLPSIRDRLDADDQSFKLLLESPRGLVETVVMRYEERTTVCVSSQVGCKLACRFCQTGRLGFVRNLEAAEILAQIAVTNELLAPEGRRVTHVVFMGMGEPLDNYDGVVRAIRLLQHPLGPGFSTRRITVSTAGLVPAIERLGHESGLTVSLAVSLNATTDEVRSQLMPVNRAYPLETLFAALRAFPLAPRRRVTLEYVLLAGVNDTLADAKRLVHLAHGLKCKVNLLAFNPWDGAPFRRPDAATVSAFEERLAAGGLTATVRESRGRDVGAACGQLGGGTQRGPAGGA